MSPAKRRRALIALGIPQVCFGSFMLRADQRMRSTGGPGIIGFELAGPDRAGQIMRTWGKRGRSAARRSLVADYPYLASYGPGLALICQAAAERHRKRGSDRLARLGTPVAVAQLAAAGFDAIENTALLGVLAGRPRSWAGVARNSALTKFALLGVGAVYAALALAPARDSSEPA